VNKMKWECISAIKPFYEFKMSAGFEVAGCAIEVKVTAKDLESATKIITILTSKECEFDLEGFEEN
jgi:hypothetical protein